MPGLNSAAIGAHNSGLGTEAVIEVTVEDEASILAEGVPDYVLRVIWATEVSKELSQISLTVWNNGTGLDLQDEANALAGVEYSAIPNLAGPVLVDWPGFRVRLAGRTAYDQGFMTLRLRQRG